MIGVLPNPSDKAGALANPEHLAKLQEGVEEWNDWRKQNPGVKPDLCEEYLPTNLDDVDFRETELRSARLGGAYLNSADLSRADLRGASLNGASLSKAHLTRADLSGAQVREADLFGANLYEANLCEANLSGSQLRDANFAGADLRRADLSRTRLTHTNFKTANLAEADLTEALLIDTNMEQADLTGCSVFGISAWNVWLEGADQSNLVITRWHEPPIQVDDLEVAQFIYLLLNNEKIRKVIDTITSKVVLILGRFTPERKIILDAIRDELRKRDYVPVLFDFGKPSSKDLTGTISTLANMARFIIADLTDPNSVPHELATVIPGTVVPFQTIILRGQCPYPMFEDFRRRYHWVLEPHQYNSEADLISRLGEQVIAPVEAKAKELARR
jgi:uncharacterized protein YjbI with pentapeptide repeats